MIVRVIFWGLIGFVPNEQVEKGMTALLIKASTVHEGQCHIPDHAPRVWLLEGECYGNCLREPAAERVRAAGVGLPGPLEQMGARYKLRWWLDGEHLEIDGALPGFALERKTRVQVQGKPAEFPSDVIQTSDFSWIPEMDVLTSGKGAINEDCLAEAKTCPISARFKITGGRASTCHLLHDTIDLAGDRDRIATFNFKLPDGTLVPNYTQAAADAIVVELIVEGDEVEIKSFDFGRETQKAAAALRPTHGSSTVTLLVGHWENPNNPQPSSNCYSAMLKRHSEAFFELLSDRSSGAARRVFKEYREEGVSPGSCEKDLEEFQYNVITSTAASKVAIPPVWPHLATECDHRQFRPSKNG